MTVKAQIVVFSHLSDAQMELGLNTPNVIKHRLNFVKYITNHCDGDLNKEIDPDVLWDKYIKSKFGQNIVGEVKHKD